jgi:hypothetical protein
MGLQIVSAFLGLAALNALYTVYTDYHLSPQIDFVLVGFWLVVFVLLGATSIGIWRMRRWAIKTLIITFGIAILSVTYQQYTQLITSWYIFFALLVPNTIVWVLVVRYLNRNIPSKEHKVSFSVE